MVDSKSWYQSKIVWGAIALSLIMILQILQEWYAKGDFSVPSCLGLAIAILIGVARVWLTDKTIRTGQPQ